MAVIIDDNKNEIDDVLIIHDINVSLFSTNDKSLNEFNWVLFLKSVSVSSVVYWV